MTERSRGDGTVDGTVDARLRAVLRDQPLPAPSRSNDEVRAHLLAAVRRRRARRSQALGAASAAVIALAIALPLALTGSSAPTERHGGPLARSAGAITTHQSMSLAPAGASSGVHGGMESSSATSPATSPAGPEAFGATGSVPTCRVRKQVIACGAIGTAGSTGTLTGATRAVSVTAGRSIMVTLPRPAAGHSWGLARVVTTTAPANAAAVVRVRGSLRSGTGSRRFTLEGEHAGSAVVRVSESACTGDDLCSAHATGNATWTLDVTVRR